MKIALILRGLPGSGKTTLLSKVSRIAPTIVHSTDDFFMDDGEYKFDIDKLGMFHKLNFKNFSISVEHNLPVVVCDNTNLAPKEYGNYVEAAKSNGYEVVAVVFEPHDIEFHMKRNTHNLPRETLERMLKRFSGSSVSVGVDKEFRDQDADALAKKVLNYIKSKQGENNVEIQ